MGFNIWKTTITAFLMDRVYQGKLVLGIIWGASLNLPRLLGPLLSCFSLLPFIVVSSFLNRIPRVGTCPISFSLQLLGVFVGTEKYGFVRHEALNTIVTTFPLDVFLLSVVFSYFIAFPILWDNMECCHWSHVASFTLSHIRPRRILHCRGGISPWVGPLTQCR